MDIWIFAIAAGVSYIAQHCKNCPLGRLVQRKNVFENISKGREFVSQGASTAEVASTSGIDGEKMVILGSYEDWNVLSISSLLPRLLSSDDLQGDWEEFKVSGDIGESSGDSVLEPSTGEMGSLYGSASNNCILRSRRANGCFIKPLSSLERFLAAQLYKKRAKMEEYMFSSIPSPSTPTLRPFFMIDGNGIISRAHGDSFGVGTRTGESKLHKENCSEEIGIVFGVPPLPNVGSLEILRKTKIKAGKERGRRLSSSSKVVSGEHSNSQIGSSHGTLLFFLGISVGIISSSLANKREVDKLNELLKQTENLVQDLQEELEMKDLLTVKELAVVDHGSHDVHEDSYNIGALHAISAERNLDESTKDDYKEFHDQAAEGGSLSKIEAELQAELERLELNMNSSSLERKLSNLVELDPDFVPDIVIGELRADVFDRQSSAQSYADRDGSSSSTTHSANYAVSPRALSLRLHEVLQSRLEERVNELETELQNSQRKVQCMESEHMKSWREFSSSETGSSFIQGSPIAKEEQKLADEPIVINISGEALDAYNEVYDEFTKTSESEEEDLPSGIKKNKRQESLLPFDQNLYWIQNGGINHYTLCHSITNGNASMTFINQKGEDHNTSSDDIYTSGDENDNSHDEMEKLLIKQLVEKTRKGSPVVLNAQRALFN